MKDLPSLSPASNASRFASRLTTSLPGLAHAALPLPVPSPEGMLWVVGLAPSEVDPDTSALRIGAPSYLSSFRADFGDFTELAPISPEPPAGSWLGELLDLDERRSRHQGLFELYGKAVPSFAAGPRALTTAARRAAVEIQTLFPSAAEPPLLPFYHALGRRFFAWLDWAAS